MRILVTNDDGIAAPGLRAAEAIAAELAGTAGEVWTVAPAFEQSGVAHAISYVRPMRIEPLGPRRFAVEGSPADCVLAGLGDVLADSPPDLVLSGVNRGRNVAEDTLYSGTVGAAMEAALAGVPAIALSQCYNRALLSEPNIYDAAEVWGARVCRAVFEGAPWGGQDDRLFYSVNFPPVLSGAVKGIRATVQGNRRAPTFRVEPQAAPNGRRFLWLAHNTDVGAADPGSDVVEAMAGHVTVTPLRADLTAEGMTATLDALF